MKKEFEKLIEQLDHSIRSTSGAIRHFVAAGAYRNDGTFVASVNGHPRHNIVPSAHAELRLLKKAPFPEEMFIVRLNRNGVLLSSMPCSRCAMVLRQRGTKWISCMFAGNMTRVRL